MITSLQVICGLCPSPLPMKNPGYVLWYIQPTCDRKVQLFIAVDKFMCMLYFYQNIKHKIVSENRTSISQKVQ